MKATIPQMQTVSNSSLPSSVREDFVQICRPLGIKTIYECGSRDAKDGLKLLAALGAVELHIFECNPEAIELCKKNVSHIGSPPNIFLNPFAIMDYDGEVEFLAVDPTRS